MPAHCEEDSFRPANLSVAANLLYFSLRVSVRVDDAAEADGGGAVAAGGHEEEFFVLVEAIGLGEIPDGA